MVKDSVVNFKDPKLTKELNLIENNRVNSLASLDRSYKSSFNFLIIR